MDILSMGTSTQGYNIPYAVIADSKASIDQYLKQTESALANPKAMIEKVQAGSDYKIPVFFTNIHPDETNGVDAPMNFIWDIVNSFENDGKITYQVITGFTPEGEAQLKKEITEAGIHWSSLIKDHVTGLGFIKDGNKSSGPVDLEKFYKIESYTLDVNQLLDHIILIVVPTENTDGRTNNVRQNGNGFDINRDSLFQTQIETQNMAKVIAKWNPATLIELHGYVSGYQVEPCSPPYEPNFEYDLFAANGLKSGEAFGIGAIANNTEFNSYVMPLRDYLVSDAAGNVKNQDYLIYAYGGAYISALPSGAEVLIESTKDMPLEGFISTENLAKFLGQVQAIEYKNNGLNVTVFAGSLTNKAHQQDEYQLAANTIFSNSLGAVY